MHAILGRNQQVLVATWMSTSSTLACEEGFRSSCILRLALTTEADRPISKAFMSSPGVSGDRVYLLPFAGPKLPEVEGRSCRDRYG